jgi:UDP-GlcNAc:undecaprenyl-phosphate/decaprenyl-phosphate GlcNAc-1-phosphate transferase
MLVPILCLGAVSFIISWLGTAAMMRLAPRLGLIDKPGGRKTHAEAKALGGGVAIFLSFAIPLLVILVYVNSQKWNPFWIAAQYADGHASGVDPVKAAYWDGIITKTRLALTLIGSLLAIHIMGLLDDRRALGPFLKLGIQLAIALAMVAPFPEMRILTAFDATVGGRGVLSITFSVLWIVAITNAFNFLDNMDGLSAGVAAVCTTAFLVTALSIGQWFVAGSLALLLGGVLGFLYWNFPPAKIFMGDSGSLVIGFALGVLTVRTTFLPPGVNWGAGWYSVFAPVIVLAVPLYDLVVVTLIRLSRGKSPFAGDTNHFSHRLVARGMSRRTAVLCLYLITAATAIAAIVLPHVQSTFLAMLIFAQTILVLGVVALLEQHPLPRNKT